MDQDCYLVWVLTSMLFVLAQTSHSRLCSHNRCDRDGNEIIFVTKWIDRVRFPDETRRQKVSMKLPHHRYRPVFVIPVPGSVVLVPGRCTRWYCTLLKYYRVQFIPDFNYYTVNTVVLEFFTASISGCACTLYTTIVLRIHV